jgi:hypothetical protein
MDFRWFSLNFRLKWERDSVKMEKIAWVEKNGLRRKGKEETKCSRF